jgi:hypothetical protein
VITSYLFLGLGAWLLYQAWRGSVPNASNPGERLSPGQPMRSTQRVLFAAGGMLFLALGLLLYFHKHSK